MVKCELGFINFECWECSLFNATRKGKMFLKIVYGISRYFINGNAIGILLMVMPQGTLRQWDLLDNTSFRYINKITFSIDICLIGRNTNLDNHEEPCYYAVC